MPQVIPCEQYASFLVSQLPYYDKAILKDIRPTDTDFMGYYQTSPFAAYTDVTHTFDRFRHVYPDTARPWEDRTSTSCAGAPCDPPANVIGWGWTRDTYTLQRHGLETDLICFDEVMQLTRAKEHFNQIITDVLRPSTIATMDAWFQRQTAELSQYKVCVSSGLPAFTFSWDPNGYYFLNTDQDPTGRLTTPILQNQVWLQYAVGGATRGADGFSNLHLRTDIDTLRYMEREDSDIQPAWRFMNFTNASKEFYKYGFKGQVGDFMVRALLKPLKFNKVAAGRYQQVLPYTNSAATQGLGSDPNTDYIRAKYAFSFVTNPGGLEIKPFVPEAVNPEMPFLVRDYGGKWRFAIDNLGADAAGAPIANYRRNKGKFYADFQFAAKPAHPEWLMTFFHKCDTPCVTIVDICNPDPGYPAQDYDMANTPCSCDQSFTIGARANAQETYTVAANSIRVDGAAITHVAIDAATLNDFVTDLQTVWTAAGYDGTWSVVSAPNRTIKVTFAAGEIAVGSIEIPFTL